MTSLIVSPNRLSDEQLISRVKDLVRHEHRATAAVIVHLAELDARRLYRGEGCSSMFTYCTQLLGFSERAAYARIEAARTLRRYPMVLDRLLNGSLNLTSVVLLAAHLTPENHVALLDEAAGRTRRQVEEIVARLRPLPPAATYIRRLPAPRVAEMKSGEDLNLQVSWNPLPANNETKEFTEDSAAQVPDLIPPGQLPSSVPLGSAVRPPDPAESLPVVPSPDPVEPPPAVPSQHTAEPPPAGRFPRSTPPPRMPSHRATIVPLAPDYYRLQVTLRSETHDRLRQAQELLRHQIPNGDPAAILDRALADLVQKLSRRKFAALIRPPK
jgi:hypothetical protein